VCEAIIGICENIQFTIFTEGMVTNEAGAVVLNLGDLFPITTTGRLVACSLMLAGIALIGVVTASFASWLIDRVRQVEEESQAATRHDVAALAADISALREEIASLREPRPTTKAKGL
jgi:voltage-gated potassium channel